MLSVLATVKCFLKRIKCQLSIKLTELKKKKELKRGRNETIRDKQEK